MKIGQFAKHFDLNKSTIRYYTEIKLLLPDTSTTYPEYDETCIRDMEDILKLKSMGFSIEEISEIKIHQRFYVNYTEDNTLMLRSLLDKKIQSHQDAIETTKAQIKAIQKYKENMGTSQSIRHIGLSFHMLRYLACPDCLSAFEISHARLQGNNILSGHMTCNCGHQYAIEDGIVLSNKKKANLKRKDKHSESSDFLSMLNNKHLSVIKKTGNMLCEDLKHLESHQAILFANADLDILIMSLDQVFRDDGHYIFCSFDFDALNTLKLKFERQWVKGHFLFLHLNGTLPLIKQIPYVIDNVGNLCDGIESYKLGYGINQFKDLSEYASMWYSIYASHRSIKAHNEFNEIYFNEAQYDEVFQEMGLKLKSRSLIGEFEYIEGMIQGVSSIDKLHFYYKKYGKDS